MPVRDQWVDDSLGRSKWVDEEQTIEKKLIEIMRSTAPGGRSCTDTAVIQSMYFQSEPTESGAYRTTGEIVFALGTANEIAVRTALSYCCHAPVGFYRSSSRLKISEDGNRVGIEYVDTPLFVVRIGPSQQLNEEEIERIRGEFERAVEGSTSLPVAILRDTPVSHAVKLDECREADGVIIAPPGSVIVTPPGSTIGPLQQIPQEGTYWAPENWTPSDDKKQEEKKINFREFI